MSYDDSRPADRTSYDRVARASADLRLMFTMDAVVSDLKRSLGPKNYTAVLEYLDCIDKNVEKMGKHAIAWAKEALDENMRDRIRRVMENPNATTNDLLNLLETRSDESQDNVAVADDADHDVGGRCLIVFDGENWYVRELSAIEYHLDDDSKSYRCAKPISGPWKSVGSAARSAINWMKKPMQDMTSTHAAASMEIAKMAYAVSEQERTKRSKEQTRRLAISGVAALALFGMAMVKPELDNVALGMITVLGGGLLFSEFFNREKKPEQKNLPDGT